tara:strand:+ start:1314 stop:1496 length:183 start_codon:yes stop_codon:yes gene_type:complete
MKQTTQELKQTLQQIVDAYNKNITQQQQYKEQIIAINAVIQDRELQDGDTNDITSESEED